MPKTKTTSTKVASTRSDVKDAVKTSPVETSTLPAGEYGKVELITPMRLKRCQVLRPYYMKSQVTDDQYRDLNILGMKLGVTWDEALRGILNMTFTGDCSGVLREYVPALNV